MAALVLGGCGGGDQQTSNTVQRVYRAPTTGQTTPEDVPASPQPTATATVPSPPPTEPQQAPGEGNGTKGGGGGGGGGTEPARTELTFRGTSAGVKPLTAGVAPFISVKVSLVSGDGSPHKLVIAGRTLSVGGTRRSAALTLPGLRPGKSYTGTADGKPVRILSTSEPGP